MMECDCLVVIGTKLETGMSNSIVREAMKKNINIIEINPEPIIKIGKTFTINGNAEDSVPQICKRTI
jgi:NAD-dependent SIR2 family protein deacetylase